MADYKYISPEDFVALIDDVHQRDKLAVVDCRDDDRGDGFIIRSIHFPSRMQTKSRFDDLALSLVKDGKTIAVFHCALSQVRGPKGASRFVSALQANNLPMMQVYVLRGGWDAFYSEFGGLRPDLMTE